MTAGTRRWLVELATAPGVDEAAYRDRLLEVGAAAVPEFTPVAMSPRAGGEPSLVFLVQIERPADEARVRALPGFVGMVEDAPVGPGEAAPRVGVRARLGP